MESLLPIIAYVVVLLFVSGIALYDWIYLKELRKASTLIGITAPAYITRLVKGTFFLAIFIVIFLVIILLSEIFY